MTYKTVSLNDKAYKLLKKAKEGGESYSDVIIRKFSEPDLKNFLSLAGFLKDEVSKNELDDFISEARITKFGFIWNLSLREITDGFHLKNL